MEYPRRYLFRRENAKNYPIWATKLKPQAPNSKQPEKKKESKAAPFGFSALKFVWSLELEL